MINYKFIYSLSFTLFFMIVFSTACVEAPPYFYAEKVTGRSFDIYDDTVGVYPSSTVLKDPNNPFKRSAPGSETKWEIEAGGDPVVGFYSWATLLTSQPTGEHQFYTALNLKAIYERTLLTNNDEDEQERLHALCVAAFQAVLDHFPRSVTYDSSGKIPYGLATLAFRSLQDLGVNPQGGWSLVSQDNGEVVAVQTLDVDLSALEEDLPEEEGSP